MYRAIRLTHIAVTVAKFIYFVFSGDIGDAMFFFIIAIVISIIVAINICITVDIICVACRHLLCIM